MVRPQWHQETSMASGGQIYGSFYLLIKDTNANSFIQNRTIAQPYRCLIKCVIQVSENLLLIESQLYIGIYALDSSQKMSIFPIVEKEKSGLTIFSDIYRHADINGNRYVIVNNSDLIFGQYDGSARSKTQTRIQIGFMSSNTLFIGLQAGHIFLVVNSTQVSIILYSCVACIINGSLGNNDIINNTNALVVDTNISAFQTFKLYQGDTVSNPYMLNAKIYWGFADGRAYKFLINSTEYQLIEIYSNVTQQKLSANHHLLVLYGSGYSINLRSFDYVASADEYILYYYSGYMSGIMTNVAISYDSTIFACHNYSDSWNIKQFMMVNNCSNYHAAVSNISSLFCQCFKYDSDNKCSISSNLSSNESSSILITIIVSVVAGFTVIVVSAIIIKKSYKRCTKGRKRTPYVYNPTELMCFEI